MSKWNRAKFLLPCIAVAGFTMLSGCAEKTVPESSGTESGSSDETIELGDSTELGEPEVAELSDEDKALVESQMFCPTGSKLGGMGTPVKVMYEGKPVFLCCEHCRESFLKDPEKGLATIEKKKQEAASESEKETKPSEEPAPEKETS